MFDGGFLRIKQSKHTDFISVSRHYESKNRQWYVGQQKGRRLIIIKSCYIYTRVSTEAQVDGYSLDAQMQALRDYAEYRELRIAGEYCDAGISGATIKGRPAFRQMMTDVAGQKDDISFVLVFKLARFGRNAADIMKSLQTLTDFGIDLVSVSESIDSSTAGGRLTLAILSAVAEMEHENITVQFMAGRVQKIKSGGWTGGVVPYGYRLNDHKLYIEEKEAEIIRAMYELYSKTEGTATSVAAALNESSYTRSNGKPFTYEFVARTLDNPIYYGRICYFRRTNRKDRNGRSIKQEPSKLISVPGNHEAIIDEELWNKVHAKRLLMHEKNKKSAEIVNTYILSGIVMCPICGKPLVGSESKSRNYYTGGWYKSICYYGCRYSDRQHGRACSFTKLLNEEIVDGLVFKIIGELQFYDEFKETLQRAVGENDTTEVVEERLKNLRKELRDTEFSKYKLGEQIDGLNPLNAGYDKKYQKLTDKLDAVYDHLDELEDDIEKTKKHLDSLEKRNKVGIQVTDFINNVKILIEKMTPEDKKELCKSFIERIDLFPEDRQDGKIIRSISFKIPLIFDGKEINATDDDEMFRFTLDCTDTDIELSEKGNIVMRTQSDGSQKVIVRKGTYQAIKAYVLEHYETKVSSLYVGQIKRKYGMDMRLHYNLAADPDKHVPHCPQEKEKMILEALKHFDMVAEDVEYREGD